jgi:hypothetical protein
MSLAAHPDAFAILGRHTQCGLVLDDPAVALRHLLVRSVSLPSGALALRLLDLHSDRAFTLPDGSSQRSIFAEGPVAVGIGSMCIVGLPTDAPLPAILPPPEVHDPVHDQSAGMGPYRRNARPAYTTRITLMPRLLMLGEPLPPRLSRLVNGGRWAITLERNGRHATQSVSEEDLAGGVVIGRSEKCHAEALRRITDTNTSRVHVLVLREPDGVYAYDLASTHGMFVGGHLARRVPLPDTGAVLTLGRGDRAVRLSWRRVGA